MAWQDRSAWSLAVMPSFVAGTDLSHAVPRGMGTRLWLSSVSQDKPSPASHALGWLLAQDMELLLAGARVQSHGVCKVLGWDSPWGHARLVWEEWSQKLPCYCPCAKSLRLYKWVLQGVCVPWGHLWNCLRNASKDLDCRLQFLRLS